MKDYQDYLFEMCRIRATIKTAVITTDLFCIAGIIFFKGVGYDYIFTCIAVIITLLGLYLDISKSDKYMELVDNCFTDAYMLQLKEYQDGLRKKVQKQEQREKEQGQEEEKEIK